MNPNYFNRNLIESMKNTIQGMISERADIVNPFGNQSAGYGKAKDPTQQLVQTPAPISAGDASGNLSMGRLTDAERNKPKTEAQKVIDSPGRGIDATRVQYRKLGSGNYGIMASPGDFSKLSDAQIENRMRAVKKGGLFQTVKDEDQSEEWQAYKNEIARRRMQQEQPKPTVTPEQPKPTGSNLGRGPVGMQPTEGIY